MKFNQGRGFFFSFCSHSEKRRVSAKENQNNRAWDLRKEDRLLSEKMIGSMNGPQILFVSKTRLDHGWKK